MLGQFISAIGIVDALITSLINEGAGRHPIVDFSMTWIALGAVPAMVASVVIQWWIGNARARRRHAALAAGLSFVLALCLNQIIIFLVQRVRPYDAGASHLIILPSADPSFPSDHATVAFAIAFSFLLLGWKNTGMAYVAVAALIALSRVYVGTHYLGDVIGGAMTAYSAAVIVWLSFQPDSAGSQRLIRFL